MIFQHTWEKVLSGEKTQTRRIVKLSERLYSDDFDPDAVVRCVNNSAFRTIYEVGKTYAVQPGRGQKSVARIELLSIEKDNDVRSISNSDVIAEGFQTQGDFLHAWVSMHDKSWYETFCYANDCDYLHEYGFFARPTDRYMAWALTFKLVRP